MTRHVIETKRRITDCGMIWLGIAGMTLVWMAGALWAWLS